VDVARGDQAVTLVNAGFELAVVDECAAHRQDYRDRSLIEEFELVSAIVDSQFAPPSRSTALLMQAVYRHAQRIKRHITSTSLPG
jgi:hypothetical protein